MHVERITSTEVLLQHWPVFKEGLREINRITHDSTTDDEYLKLLLDLVTRADDAWIGLAFQGGPVSYAVVVNSTPPHAGRTTFTVSSFFAVPGFPEVTVGLMQAFEAWAREHGVHSYTVTTKRDTGAAVRCVGSRRYGFNRSFLVSEKFLN